MHSKNHDIFFIAVHYRSSTSTTQFLRSIVELSYPFFQHVTVVIVDNSSDYAVPLDLQIKYDHDSYFTLLILAPEVNLGYFGGINHALACFPPQKQYSPVVISNNDIIFTSEFFRSLVMSLNSHPNSPVICPQVVSNNVYENPHVSLPPSMLRELLYSLYYNFYLFAIVFEIFKTFKKFTTRTLASNYQCTSFFHPKHIYQGYGAIYILTPAFFDRFSHLHSPPFLYFEEFFISEQVAQIDQLPLFDPSLLVYHVANSSTSLIPPMRLHKYKRESFKIYRKFINPFGRNQKSLAFKLSISLDLIK